MSYLNTVGVGDALEYLRQVPDESVDSCVTDAPYGLGNQPSPVEVMGAWMRGEQFKPSGKRTGGFMEQDWDEFVPGPAVWREVYRVLKPGGWLISFFGSRTFDWGTMAIRFAGFEIHDSLMWVYGTGFPKSHNISKAIDALLSTGQSDSHAMKHANDNVRTGDGRRRASTTNKGISSRDTREGRTIRDEPATEEGKAWRGWGTALKPGFEPACLARKPFDGTYAEHTLGHGTGALNIDASRIGANAGWSYPHGKGGSPCHKGGFKDIACESTGGRWPANVILSHLPSCELVGTKRVSTGTAVKRNLPPEGASRRVGNKARTQRGDDETYADADGKEEIENWSCVDGCPVAELDRQSGGGASRFFYAAKAPNTERWSYCKTCKLAFQHESARFKEHDDHKLISHPTQKPLDLMEYLVRLVTQKGGVVLDPFCGTGSTPVAAKRLGFNFVTCDLDPDYTQIASARLAMVGREAGSALTSGAYFCPGCKAKGEIKLIAKDAVDRMRASGRKTTCMKCMKRYTAEELVAE